MNRPAVCRQACWRSSRYGAPDIGVLMNEPEACRHHADDLRRPIVQLDDAADDGGVAGEAALPQLIAEHRDAGCVRTIVGLRRHAAEEWRDAEQWKEFRGHELHVQSNRIADAGQRRGGRPPGRQALKRAAVALPIEPVGGRHAVAESPGWRRQRSERSRTPRPADRPRDRAADAAAADRRSRRWRCCRRWPAPASARR